MRWVVVADRGLDALLLSVGVDLDALTARRPIRWRRRVLGRSRNSVKAD